MEEVKTKYEVAKEYLKENAPAVICSIALLGIAAFLGGKEKRSLRLHNEWVDLMRNGADVYYTPRVALTEIRSTTVNK